MTTNSRPPAVHQRFVARFPRLGKAWDLANEEGGTGPLDEKTQRLVKLAVAIGAMREGAVHSGVRKARAAGASLAEMEQVVALAASAIGLPSAVAVWTWVHDQAGPPSPRRARRPEAQAVSPGRRRSGNRGRAHKRASITRAT
jgi:alkylhydroperoxidase/carboxymuconolactone decarboxylase family protein YurZ